MITHFNLTTLHLIGESDTFGDFGNRGHWLAHHQHSQKEILSSLTISPFCLSLKKLTLQSLQSLSSITFSSPSLQKLSIYNLQNLKNLNLSNPLKTLKLIGLEFDQHALLSGTHKKPKISIPGGMEQVMVRGWLGCENEFCYLEDRNVEGGVMMFLH